MAQRRALVIGGSMSGLLAAIMLRRRGWEVDVFERVESELAGRGAGIVAQAELIAQLEALGLDTARSRRPHRTPANSRPRGRVPTDHAMPASPDRLGARLPGAARCLSGGALSPRPRACAHSNKRRRASLRISPTAARREGDVLIGADGLRSTVRQPVPARRRAALCRLCRVARDCCRRARIPPAIHRELFDAMTFCLPPGEQCLGYPVAGPTTICGPAIAATTSSGTGRPTRRRELPLAAHRRQRRHAFDLDSAAAHPRARRSPPCARRPSGCWRRNFARIVRLIDEPILQPIYDLASPRLAFGRVAHHRRCRLRGAAACRRRRLQGGRRCGGAGGSARRRRRGSRRCAASRRSACRTTTASSSARAISAPICRRRRAPRSAPARRGTAFRKRCSPKPRFWISCTRDCRYFPRGHRVGHVQDGCSSG